MGEITHIAWTDKTFNPWEGCSKVSAGCANCYAEARDKRFTGGTLWGKGKARRRTSKSNWNLPLRWNREHLWTCHCGKVITDREKGLGIKCWQGHDLIPIRSKVFCASLADWLDDEVPIEWLADLLKVIHDTPNLDWQLLSKRIHNFRPRLQSVVDFMDNELSTGYYSSHEDTSTERKDGLRGNRIWRNGNRRSGESVEGQEANLRPLDEGHKNDSMQSSQGRDSEQRRVSTSAVDEKREASSGGSPSADLVPSQRVDSSRVDDQSQKQFGGQVRQQAEQSGISDLQRTEASRDKGTGCQACGREGGEKSQASSNGSARDSDEEASRRRGDGATVGERVWYDKKGGLGNLSRADMEAFTSWVKSWLSGTAPQNVWIGTSTENQAMADKRIPELLKIPAKVRFLSVEPMLENVRFQEWFFAEHGRKQIGARMGINWTIFGGESGTNARPCNIDWIRDGVKQCQAAGVKVFVKQWGSRPIGSPKRYGTVMAAQSIALNDKKGGDMNEWPEDLCVREFPEVAS